MPFIRSAGRRCHHSDFGIRRKRTCGSPGVWGHRRNYLTLDHFGEGLAIGIFADEPWVENEPRVTR